MFKIKKTAQVGKCRAQRCAKAPHEASADGFCDTHLAEWSAAGSPELHTLLGSEAAADAEQEAVKLALTKERGIAQQSLAMVAAIPVDTPEQREKVGLLIKQAGQRVRALDEERRSATSKLREVIDQISGWFAPNKELWTQVKVGLQRKLDEKLAQLEAERVAAAALITAGTASSEDYQAYHTDVSAPSTVRVLERVTYAIEDMGALPDEYWCPDYAKIEADTRAGKAIPGVRRIVEKHTGAK